MKEGSELALEDGGRLETGSSKDREYTQDEYLRLTRSAYESSEDFYTASLKMQWEKNYSNFMSKHPQGSKYRSDAYKHRSRLFRPKTRSNVRQKEAALSAAFFSTSDALVVSPSDTADPLAAKSARLVHEVVNLRLKKTLPWFKLLIGAFQTTQVVGTVISHQYWEYEEIVHKKKQTQDVWDSEIGQIVPEEYEEEDVEVIKDRPVVELVESENLLIDPGADWLDPINSSPYIIHMIPMYLGDILDKMELKDSKTGQPEWIKMQPEDIVRKASSNNSGDSLKQTRDGNRKDPQDKTSYIDEHQVIWVYRVIMRFSGKGDYIWYTLGTEAMLSEPVPLEDAYLHGNRPYAMGNSIIEAFRNYPTSPVELTEDLQAAANDILNQRFDNVKQVLNKRYFVRRGGTVDLRSLRRNVPASITLMSDIEKDVRVHETNDVTSSAYQEQNLVNVDMDEISGSFSSASVQSNRQLGETVGGMRMLKDPSNIMTEYMIMTFAMTWVKDVLTQVVDLIKAYETDEKVLKAAGEKAGEKRLPPNWEKTDFDIEINVGYGVTDPQARITKILYGIDAVQKMTPQAMQKLKEEEVVSEIFGILGYQDGSRFFMNEQEFKQFQQQNPPGESPDMAKIKAEKEMFAAELELKRQVEAEKIMSGERIAAAEIIAKQQDNVTKAQLGLAEQDIKFKKLQLDELNIGMKREDMLRKDAEIKDKEQPVIDRNQGGPQPDVPPR